MNALAMRGRSAPPRLVIATALLVALLLGPSQPAAAADQIVCGVDLGFVPATASAAGSLVIGQAQPPPAAPSRIGAAVTVVIPPGTQVALPSGYFCVRFSTSGTTNTFVGLVAPGSPGFLPPPTPGPAASGGTSPTAGSPAIATIDVCGQLSSFTPQDALHPSFGTVSLAVGGRLVNYQVTGAGTVTPANLISLGSALHPISARLTGTSDGTFIRFWALTQVSACAVGSLPNTSTARDNSAWLALAFISSLAVVVAGLLRGRSRRSSA